MLTYTEREWGIEQRRAYRRRLVEALARLAEFPELGVAATDLGEGRRRFRVGQHVVYYRAFANELRMDRLIHVRRDRTAFGDSET